jgi:hypothetical protein
MTATGALLREHAQPIDPVHLERAKNQLAVSRVRSSERTYATMERAVEELFVRGTVTSVPAQVDVLIVGCGPAGLTLAAQLAAFPDIRTCIVEQKDGPLQLGQADGIACRTMEMFEAFNFSERVLKEACWINEVTFWKPDEKQPGTSCATAACRTPRTACPSFRTWC